MLWTLSGLMVLAGAGALAWSLTTKLDFGDERSGATAIAPRAASAAANDSVEQLEHIWKRDVRRPLNESSVSVQPIATVVNSTPAVMNLKLVGTAVDARQQCAIFTDPQQNALICTVGHAAQGVKVLAIDSKKVVVEFQGQHFDLVVPDQLDAPAQTLMPAVPEVAPVPATSPTYLRPDPPISTNGAAG
jgi:hypothetical protein